MRLKSSIFFIIVLLSICNYSYSEESPVVGVWLGEVKNRMGQNFKAHLGIRKQGDNYQVRGISVDQSIMWYGEGYLNGNEFIYSYKIRNKDIRGTATLKLSSDGQSLSGGFGEESTKKSGGSESWEKYNPKSETEEEKKNEKDAKEPKNNRVEEEKPLSE